MASFIINGIIWTLALYGMIEIIKEIIYIFSYTKLKSDGIYVIIAAKNQENIIETFMRTFLFRIIYGKEESIKDIIAVDLDSTDATMEILQKLNKDYECIRISSWKECKELLDNININ